MSQVLVSCPSCPSSFPCRESGRVLRASVTHDLHRGGDEKKNGESFDLHCFLYEGAPVRRSVNETACGKHEVISTGADDALSDATRRLESYYGFEFVRDFVLAIYLANVRELTSLSVWRRLVWLEGVAQALRFHRPVNSGVEIGGGIDVRSFFLAEILAVKRNG